MHQPTSAAQTPTDHLQLRSYTQCCTYSSCQWGLLVFALDTNHSEPPCCSIPQAKAVLAQMDELHVDATLIRRPHSRIYVQVSRLRSTGHSAPSTCSLPSPSARDFRQIILLVPSHRNR
ncbi:hypothetical protein TgHK011_004575 [Trichoderma gracile]|nr:hypothetical protein TgHK011_004575 [Trichoderma gracile]